MQILLSRTQAGPGRTVKQEQEEISPNHVQTFSGCSVCIDFHTGDTEIHHVVEVKLIRMQHSCCEWLKNTCAANHTLQVISFMTRELLSVTCLRTCPFRFYKMICNMKNILQNNGRSRSRLRVCFCMGCARAIQGRSWH